MFNISVVRNGDSFSSCVILNGKVMPTYLNSILVSTPSDSEEFKKYKIQQLISNQVLSQTSEALVETDLPSKLIQLLEFLKQVKLLLDA